MFLRYPTAELYCLSVSFSLSISVCHYLSLSVIICLCLSLPVSVRHYLYLSIIICLCLSFSVCVSVSIRLSISISLYFITNISMTALTYSWNVQNTVSYLQYLDLDALLFIYLSGISRFLTNFLSWKGFKKIFLYKFFPLLSLPSEIHWIRIRPSRKPLYVSVWNTG